EDHAEADVQVGAFKVRQPVGALRRVAPTKVDRPSRTARLSLPPAPRVDQELHLRGMRAHEVEEVVDQYLDQAARASLPWVRIVHGKGSGALRAAVHEVLRAHPVVERFELADRAEGGEGATIAYLRD
ncbi:MAG: Smr/MutS family protein, partial [Thermomicrobiaceae bacterium]|nr:Smr/MutS family protein [Thermomicrobiaceae bacterium]